MKKMALTFSKRKENKVPGHIKNGKKIENEYGKEKKNSFQERIKIMNHNNILTGNTFIILILFILINLPISFVSGLSTTITLKIRGIGYKKVFGLDIISANQLYPNYIYINGEKQEKTKSDQYLNQTDNFVKLVWNTNIRNCSYLFYGCKDIYEIDFSYFATSQIIDVKFMFGLCESLTSLNLSNFITSSVTDMWLMFHGCSSLISLNLSNFDTSKVTRMEEMFFGCSSLISIDLTNFVTSNVNDMKGMFQKCSSLKSIDLSNFDTSKVTDMSFMFCLCSSLTFVDLSNFKTSNLNKMSNMFRNCSSLLSINLSSFDTSKVNDMERMFFGCSSLTSINLSNFNLMENYVMNHMFYDCVSLEYLNLKNFRHVSGIVIENNILENVPDNLIVCISENNFPRGTLNQIKQKQCYNESCSDNWAARRKMLIEETGTCVNSCSDDEIYKYEYNNKCYKNCINGFLEDDNKKCKCELEKCLICSPGALYHNLCNKCNKNYYPIENDIQNKGNYINCYKNPEGYYLDKVDFLYKKCFDSCQTCNMKGDSINNNCLTCKENVTCDINDKNNEILDDKKKNDDKEINSNVKQNFILNYDIDEVIKNLNITLGDSREDEIYYYDAIINYIESVFTSRDYNLTNLDNGIDEMFDFRKIKVLFTTTKNQKYNINNEMTVIDFENCETLLRSSYNISNNKILYMKKIDIIQDKMKIPKIEYDIYEYNGTNLEKLDLSICKNRKIILSIPINISENIDMVNSSSEYYNSICYPATSESGTDITLKDRKKLFIEDNKTICQDDCIFSEYNYITKRAECSCNVKQSPLSFADMYINSTKLYNNFIDIKNIANINILTCYNVLLCKKGILKNIGSYIIILIIIFHIISFFIFCVKYTHEIKNKIKNIIHKIKNLKLIHNNDKSKKEQKNKKFIKNFSKSNKSKDNATNKIFINSKKSLKKANKNILKINKNNNMINFGKNSNIKTNRNKASFNANKNIINNIRNNFTYNNVISKNKFKKVNKKSTTIKKTSSGQITKIVEYNDDEINNFSYELAIKLDKRTYFQYYFSLLKTKHNLLFSFFYNKDYNLKILLTLYINFRKLFILHLFQ